MKKYTSGPWKVIGRDIVKDHGNNNITSIALASLGNGSMEESYEFADLNARLISAAPDLLEVCENLFDWICESFPHPPDRPAELLLQASEAICKAREEED